MGLLQPESGLLFWMTLAFVVVLVVLARYGFPVIVKAIESRKEYIDSSLDAARDAEQKCATLEARSREIINEAEVRRNEILREADTERKQILADARQKAESEGARLLEKSRLQAETERAAILADAKREIAALAVAITERMLRQDLDNREAQTQLASRLMEEFDPKNRKTWTPD